MDLKEGSVMLVDRVIVFGGKGIFYKEK